MSFTTDGWINIAAFPTDRPPSIPRVSVIFAVVIQVTDETHWAGPTHETGC
jgi:hypothetical protein